MCGWDIRDSDNTEQCEWMHPWRKKKRTMRDQGRHNREGHVEVLKSERWTENRQKRGMRGRERKPYRTTRE